MSAWPTHFTADAWRSRVMTMGTPAYDAFKNFVFTQFTDAYENGRSSFELQWYEAEYDKYAVALVVEEMKKRNIECCDTFFGVSGRHMMKVAIKL